MSKLAPISFYVTQLGMLTQRLEAAFKDLRAALRGLTFADNFQSFEVDVTIDAGEEAQIRNGFRDGAIPSRFIKVYEAGPGVIVASGTPWTSSYVYLINNASTSTGRVIAVFLR